MKEKDRESGMENTERENFYKGSRKMYSSPGSHRVLTRSSDYGWLQRR
jgi:hypothetical protein